MTDLTPLKTMLVEALTRSLTSETINHVGVYGTDICFEGPSAMFTSVTFDADRLATAIHDHFFGDRTKVRLAIIDAIRTENPDQAIDRFVARLAGGSQ